MNTATDTHALAFLGNLMVACAATTEAAIAEALCEIKSKGLTHNNKPATVDDLFVIGVTTDDSGKVCDYGVRAD